MPLQYRRRKRLSRPCSGWERVGHRRYDHQKPCRKPLPKHAMAPAFAACLPRTRWIGMLWRASRTQTALCPRQRVRNRITSPLWPGSPASGSPSQLDHRSPRLTHSQTFPTTGRVRPAELYTFDFRKRKGRTRRIHGKQNTIGKQRADAKIRRPSPWIWPVTPRTPVSGAAPARAEKTQGRPCRHAQNNASPVCSYPRLRNPWGWARQRLRNPWGWARQRLV